jgi:O-antigen/teichoic acid export membrane protein
MASRTRNFVRGLGAGYLAIAVNIAYTAASIPLALHYLGKEQFGLWALAQQIAGYLVLLDLGVSSAVSRFIADHKDDVKSDSYGSLLLAGAIVFAIQGVLISIAGAAFSFFAPTLFAVPERLAGDFKNVLIIITSLAGFSVAFRTFGAPLWAFQRIDISYGLGSLTLLTSFAALWGGFHLGWGIYSFAFAGIPAAILCPIITFLICWKSGFYPSAVHWGQPNLLLFRKIFSFGQDVVWVSMGSQLVNASQIMILSRVVGLNAAATFAVGTKLFTMGQQFTGRIIESSAPGLTEMFVRGDAARFNLRFDNAVALTTFLATLGASGLVAGNTAVVALWTSGAIRWDPACDALLAGILIATSLTRCLTGLFGLAGNLRPIRYIYFIEGCLFIALAIPTASHFGAVGLLFVALASHLAVTAILSLRASAKILRSVKPMVFSGLASLIITSGVFLLSLWPPNLIANPFAIFLKVPLMVLSAGVSGWFFILTPSLRKEIADRLFLIIQENRKHPPSQVGNSKSSRVPFE